MNTTKTLIAGAAVAGLMAGSMAGPRLCSQRTYPSRSLSPDDGGEGQHTACKGQNACKGQGGCKTGDRVARAKTRARARAAAPPRASSQETRAQTLWLSRNYRKQPPLSHEEAAALRNNRPYHHTMPANPFNAYTDYGIGIGLRVPHYRHILEKKPVVDWFEIISENFMVDGGRPLEVLDSILEQYRVVQHGVAIYFGSADKLNREHLKKLKRLVKRTEHAMALRPSVLGKRGRALYARSAADALYIRGGPGHRAKDPRSP